MPSQKNMGSRRQRRKTGVANDFGAGMARRNVLYVGRSCGGCGKAQAAVTFGLVLGHFPLAARVNVIVGTAINRRSRRFAPLGSRSRASSS